MKLIFRSNEQMCAIKSFYNNKHLSIDQYSVFPFKTFHFLRLGISKY